MQVETSSRKSRFGNKIIVTYPDKESRDKAFRAMNDGFSLFYPKKQPDNNAETGGEGL